MRKVDAIGIGIGVVAIVLAGLAFGAKRIRRGSVAECPHHLKEIYVSYEVFTSEGGVLFPEFQSKSSTANLISIPPGRVADAYRLLCSNGLASASTVCPRDTRRPASTVVSLTNSNLSYFISINTEAHEPNIILAGNRNLSESKRAIHLATESLLRWRPNEGLHGTNGYLLLRDGSVRLAGEDELRALAKRPVNNSNVILIP
jgi:hypothetical protein